MGIDENDVYKIKQSYRNYKIAIKYGDRRSNAYKDIGAAAFWIYNKIKDEKYLRRSIRYYALAIKMNKSDPDNYFNLASVLLKYREVKKQNKSYLDGCMELANMVSRTN